MVVKNNSTLGLLMAASFTGGIPMTSESLWTPSKIVAGLAAAGAVAYATHACSTYTDLLGPLEDHLVPPIRLPNRTRESALFNWKITDPEYVTGASIRDLCATTEGKRKFVNELAHALQLGIVTIFNTSAVRLSRPDEIQWRHVISGIDREVQRLHGYLHSIDSLTNLTFLYMPIAGFDKYFRKALTEQGVTGLNQEETIATVDDGVALQVAIDQADNGWARALFAIIRMTPWYSRACRISYEIHRRVLRLHAMRDILATLPSNEYVVRYSPFMR